VAVTYRTHEPDDELTTELSTAGEAVLLPLDATAEDEVASTMQRLAGEFGSLDILVNNAGGLVQRSTIAEMDFTLWRKVIAVNLDSMFLVTHHALPFLAAGGRIINVASLAGRNGGHPGATAYASSKAAVFGFTRGLAKELAPSGLVSSRPPPFTTRSPPPSRKRRRSPPFRFSARVHPPTSPESRSGLPPIRRVS
jgi:3-oxoacyl-[acyl-carrier protein] reductase